MFTLINYFLLQTPADSGVHLAGIIDANNTFIAIYGVLFTILISVGVYVYGIKDPTEKRMVVTESGVTLTIILSLCFFGFSFLAPEFIPVFLIALINFCLIGYLFFRIGNTFLMMGKYHKDELSAQRMVKKFKRGIIEKKLKEFGRNKLENETITEALKEKKVERFLFDNDLEMYDLIRSKQGGYVAGINLKQLTSEPDSIDKDGIKPGERKREKYYLPLDVAIGSYVAVDSVLMGVRKKAGRPLPDKEREKLASLVLLEEDFENPGEYLEAEVFKYYDQLFKLIGEKNTKAVEAVLKDFAGFVDLVVKSPDPYVDIVQFLSDDIIVPLQKHAFNTGEFDVIRKVLSFSLGYVYGAIQEKLIGSLKIFLRNLVFAFYLSIDSTLGVSQEVFYDTYFRWIHEINRYSIYPNLEKGDDSFQEYATEMLYFGNSLMKAAYDKKAPDIFAKTVHSLDSSFEYEDYHYDKKPELEKVILRKKAVLFGFAAWAYQLGSSAEDFSLGAFERLLGALQPDSRNLMHERETGIDYYLSIYKETEALADFRSFGWADWGKPEGHVYTVTIHEELRRLLIDRLISVFSKNPELGISVRQGNYDETVAMMKKGGHYDLLSGKTKDYFHASSLMTDDQFDSIKNKIFKLFELISNKREQDVENEIVEKEIDEEKFTSFSKENIESYHSSQILYNLGVINKLSGTTSTEAFGYNILLNKDQFIANTGVSYTRESQFGENVARAEDNNILSKISSDVVIGDPIAEKNLLTFLNKQSNFETVVLWSSNYIYLDRTDEQGFKPRWQAPETGETKGTHYLGTINDKPIYWVEQEPDNKTRYGSMVFLLKKDAFMVNESEPFLEAWESNVEALGCYRTGDKSVVIEVKALSKDLPERERVVDRWIAKDMIQGSERDSEIEKLKLKVIMKFFKALEVASLIVGYGKVRAYPLK